MIGWLLYMAFTVQPSVPGLPTVPSLTQPAYIVTHQGPNTVIQRSIPGLPSIPDPQVPALIVPPHAPEPLPIPVETDDQTY